MAKNMEKLRWFVEVPWSVMKFRLIVCSTLGTVNLLSWLYLRPIAPGDSPFNPLIFYVFFSFATFSLTFDVMEYLQTKKFIRRTSGPSYERTGKDAFFYFIIYSLALIVVLLLPLKWL